MTRAWADQVATVSTPADPGGGEMVHDYVIVGAGPAACVLANRLSEDPTRGFSCWSPGRTTICPRSGAEWVADGTGPMATLGAEVGGFVRTGLNLTAPDIQLGLLPGPAPSSAPALPDRRAVAVLVAAVAARSRGSVTLVSADPSVRPLVDPGYPTESADLDALVAGVRITQQIASCRPLSDHIEGLGTPPREASDLQLRRWVRGSLGTMFHPTGTCAMGGAEDSVCGPDLRVRGVDSLRVVDASVMPVTLRGNTNAPTIALAERAADLIAGRVPLLTGRTEAHAVS